MEENQILDSDVKAMGIPPKPPGQSTGIAAQRAFLTMKPGDEVDIGGVRCRLQHINQGRRRLTIVPVDPKQRMPLEQMKDPILRVTGPRKG